MNDEPSDESSAANNPLDEPAREAQRLFDISLDLLCVASPDGYFLQVNPAFEQVLGYSEETLTSQPIVEFVHPDDRESTRETLVDSAAGEVKGFTNRYVCKDGSVVWLEWQSKLNDTGDRIYACARNITELKHARLERDRLETKFQKAQKLESVAILAGGIAHDFNNLLTTVLGNAGLLLMDLDDSNPIRERAQAIQRAASTAADMCEQLLAYAGEGQFDVEPLDLTDIVRKTDHLIGATVSTAVQLDYDLADDLPPAELDLTQMRQILMNAVNNASDALEGDHDGRIHIATGVRDCDRADLADMYLDDDLAEGSYVYLEVADTGCGMTQAEVRRIFDPFYTTKVHGRGLGLAATLGIVRAHNGAVQVDSTPDQGTTFRFYFPVCEQYQVASNEHDEVSLPELDCETILVADSQPDIRELVERVLASHDIGVLKADNGTEAVEAFTHHRDEISAILLDFRMPATDTREVYRRLHEIDETVPVIFSSGYNESSSVTSLEGVDDELFLHKPYGPADLLRTLSAALRP